MLVLVPGPVRFWCLLARGSQVDASVRCAQALSPGLAAHQMELRRQKKAEFELTSESQPQEDLVVVDEGAEEGGEEGQAGGVALWQRVVLASRNRPAGSAGHEL